LRIGRPDKTWSRISFFDEINNFRNFRHAFETLFPLAKASDSSNLGVFSRNLTNCVPQIVGYFSVGALFVAGELDRRDQEAPLGKTQLDFLRKINFLKIPLIIGSSFLCIKWLAMYRSEILANLEAIGSNWISVLFAVLLVAISSSAIIKLQTRRGKPPAIV